MKIANFIRAWCGNDQKRKEEPKSRKIWHSIPQIGLFLRNPEDSTNLQVLMKIKIAAHCPVGNLNNLSLRLIPPGTACISYRDPEFEMPKNANLSRGKIGNLVRQIGKWITPALFVYSQNGFYKKVRFYPWQQEINDNWRHVSFFYLSFLDVVRETFISRSAANAQK